MILKTSKKLYYAFALFLVLILLAILLLYKFKNNADISFKNDSVKNNSISSGYSINEQFEEGTTLNFSISFPQKYINDKIVFMYSYIPLEGSINLFDPTVKNTFNSTTLTKKDYNTTFNIPYDGFYTFYIVDYTLDTEITYDTVICY